MTKQPILVVDDDDGARTMLCIVLCAEGYRAIGAADGVEALERIRSDGVPALVFVDLMMPRMDGEGLRREMTRDPSLSHVPIAIISGQMTERPVRQSPGVIASVTKPIELDDLLNIARQFALPGVS